MWCVACARSERRCVKAEEVRQALSSLPSCVVRRSSSLGHHAAQVS